jgi:tRNA A-37 threonylcarbamoyl transferase component Bud32
LRRLRNFFAAARAATASAADAGGLPAPDTQTAPPSVASEGERAVSAQSTGGEVEASAPVSQVEVEPAAVEQSGKELDATPSMPSTEASPSMNDAGGTGEVEMQAEATGDAAREVRSGEVRAAEDRTTGGERNRTSAVPGTARSGSTGKLRRQAKQLDPGTMLYSRYEIVRRIGGGGMGAVYLAKDKNLGDQPRAVKEMIQSNIDESQHEKAINDFKRESMLLASLEHPSIPTIYDYFYDDNAGRFYLVMKFISGGDFLARLRNAPGGRVDEKTVTDWACQVADVLEYLHRRPTPIIYRDLKPANLMIDGASGRVMLIDFGIARWVTTQEKGVTAVGTMGYAPPELFSGKVEPRSDIYSLGATMFHLLTGSDPQDNPLLIFDFNKNPRPRQLAPRSQTRWRRS